MTHGWRTDPDFETHLLHDAAPDWYAWRGVSGLYYARRPRSSPPKVVRAKVLGGLMAEIDATYERV